MADKKAFHEQVAEKLIAQLKQGTAPWQRPWAPGEAGAVLPMNPTTGKRYKGINSIQLMSQGHGDNRWMTYKQAQAAGDQVRADETGTSIQFWKFSEEQTQPERERDAHGKRVKEQVRLERPKVFFATVFNAQQIDGLPPRQAKERNEQTWSAVERAEQILQASGAVIRHREQDRAFYRPATDSIHLPEKAQFATADNYYAIALHELGHWTGHESRLGRDLAHPFGSQGYAKEELRAEIASMIIGDELGIGHDPDQHAAYVKTWIEALEDDPLEIFRAAADAEKIQSFVLALEQQQVQTQASRQEADQTINEGADMTQQAREKAEALTVRADADPQRDIEQEPSELAAEIAAPEAAELGQQPGKTLLNVPFKEKDEAKTLGARWSRQDQSWYLPAGVDPAPFAKWAQDAARAVVAGGTADQATHAGSDGQKPAEGRLYLAVPYGERIAAKAAGAEWDKAAKSWYAGPKANRDKLQRWLPDNVPGQQAPAMNPREEFAEALRSVGCVVAEEHPLMDGQKHRIGVVDDKQGEQAGFYVGHLDGHPAGYIKNNRTGVDMKWKSKGYALDPEQKAALAAEAAEKLQARAAEQDRLHERVAQRVARQMTELVPVEQPTPYMQAKGIALQPGALTDREGQKTYIPAIDADGKQWTTQYIQEDGTKRFAKDSRKEGCFHAIGGLDAIATAPAIVIAEGYATAASLKEALGFGTVAAFDSGNLPHVARALHEKFPDKPIIIAGDDDRHLEATQGINPGRTKAEEAAKAVGGVKMLPIFAPGEQNADPKGFTDFNDLATKSVLGQESVVRQAGAVVGKAIEQHQVRAERLQRERVQGQDQEQRPRRAVRV